MTTPQRGDTADCISECINRVIRVAPIVETGEVFETTFRGVTPTEHQTRREDFKKCPKVSKSENKSEQSRVISSAIPPRTQRGNQH